MKRAATLGVCAGICLAMVLGAAPERFLAPFNDVKPVLEAMRDQLPPELSNANEASWNSWGRRQDTEIRARLEQGEVDSMINLLLFGTSFTKRPRIQFESLAADTKLFVLAPVLKHVLRSLPGIASDIKKPGGHEIGYDRVPVRAAATLPQLWGATTRRLGEVTQPVLVYRSAVDHVVGPASMRVLLNGLAASQVTVRECPDSYHVATLDNDAGAIFEGSVAFVRDHA